MSHQCIWANYIPALIWFSYTLDRSCVNRMMLSGCIAPDCADLAESRRLTRLSRRFRSNDVSSPLGRMILYTFHQLMGETFRATGGRVNSELVFSHGQCAVEGILHRNSRCSKTRMRSGTWRIYAYDWAIPAFKVRFFILVHFSPMRQFSNNIGDSSYLSYCASSQPVSLLPPSVHWRSALMSTLQTILHMIDALLGRT